MSEPAPKRRMTVAEFLKWDHGTDTVYELIDGLPVARYARSGNPSVVAMAPPAPRHGRIAVNVAGEVERCLEGRRPCGAEALAKVQDYIALPSIQEIWLVDSRRRWLQQWRRDGEDQWIVTLPLTGSARFDSPTLAGTVELDRLYRNTGLDAPAPPA